jgi:outer membrane protein OmpA-like peptidoglycan-associated protein
MKGHNMRKFNTVKQLAAMLWVVLGLVMLSQTAPAQEDIKASLFKDATEAMQNAKKNQADVLSPNNFAKAMDYYQDAEKDFQQGRNLEDIRRKLRAAIAYFGKANEVRKLAEVTFVSTIKARNDALNADAPTYASNEWQEAEKKFADAAGKLEDGNVNSAKRKAAEAEAEYRKAELSAIKTNYLQETWQLLEQAKKMKVKDRAPKTLARAQDLVQRAEKELNENRYDTDVARNLAQQAKYEAKHALYLSNYIQQTKKQKVSEEDILLQAEAPLQKIAAEMDLVAEFDNGIEFATQKIIDKIHEYQDLINQYSQEIADLKQQNSDLTARIEELEAQLGTVAQQQSELQKRMEAQARIRQQFQEVEKMFNRDEARVLREGNDIIIRMVGLNFASGKAVIEPRYFSLLSKVQNAINIFPGSEITVEGHTDSFGGDEVNLRLSQERAEAVRQYLLANMRNLSADQVKAVGYGESKPIANNETAEGRAKNRRIDIVITPKLDTQVE